MDSKNAPETPLSGEITAPMEAMMSQMQVSAPPSPMDWSNRGAADGLSNQHDSDFGKISQTFDICPKY